MEKVTHEEMGLDRKNTLQSLASEILDWKRKVASSSESMDDLSLIYLFRSIVPLIRDQWSNYFFGAVSAYRKCFSTNLGAMIDNVFSGGHRLRRFGSGISQQYPRAFAT